PQKDGEEGKISEPLSRTVKAVRLFHYPGPLCEGAPPAGGGGENLAIIRHILGYGKVLSLRPCGATSLAEGGKGLFFTLSTIFCLKIFTKNPKKLFKFPQQCGKVVSNRRECSKITAPQ
uniref:hypothetical protein n=1 Tax=Gemmiger formicilis TaxID=745368 RepID=UPI003FEFB321